MQGINSVNFKGLCFGKYIRVIKNKLSVFYKLKSKNILSWNWTCFNFYEEVKVNKSNRSIGELYLKLNLDLYEYCGMYVRVNIVTVA